ncbi:family 10 glycosylhydrolase [Cellulophaga sp. E16_2]|uniref:glycoside hydrolase family 10 protein n=1 Tax=Cellulophaga sp. E16_2 TaxID=2789297 RepID=UPI001A92BA58|nr:family 10 glycosylhydrolase [Cellulophaga sp. E16_2]MBO0592448.1 family 10 glycosylhydrolase [Cellulophaga sp. E16_2]
MKKIFLIVLLALFTSCAALKQKLPEREFRGFWVATVVNIDWPKNGKDAIEKQKEDYLKILDFYDQLNFNTAIVQIRTAGDAFYPSDYAPWSQYLTGEQGIAPDTEENLLAWMISETHERGMEFHAWLNPYRATFDLNTTLLSEQHDYYTHPDWMVKYGKKYYYNPGEPAVQDHMIALIDEIVKNYTIDAIHFDDYFYPYKITGETFNDVATFNLYKLPNQTIEDWRRSSIDSLIRKTHYAIKKEKPWVQFGVSPFGVWKNKATDSKGSDTQAGQTTYDDLYADPLLWMQEGWIDYIIPQAYWSIALPVASHKTIMEWWAANSPNTNLYMGNGPYKIRNNSDKAWDNKKELPNQIKLGRKTPNIQGNAFFSAKSLMNDHEDVVNILKRKYYSKIALNPSTPNRTGNKIAIPKIVRIHKTNTSVNIQFNGLENFRYGLAFGAKKSGKNQLKLKKLLRTKIPLSLNSITLSNTILKNKKKIALVFIDKFGQETQPIFINLDQIVPYD